MHQLRARTEEEDSDMSSANQNTFGTKLCVKLLYLNS
jgi:hypothetical protein